MTAQRTDAIEDPRGERELLASATLDALRPATTNLTDGEVIAVDRWRAGQTGIPGADLPLQWSPDMVSEWWRFCRLGDGPLRALYKSLVGRLPRKGYSPDRLAAVTWQINAAAADYTARVGGGPPVRAAGDTGDGGTSTDWVPRDVVLRGWGTVVDGGSHLVLADALANAVVDDVPVGVDGNGQCQALISDLAKLEPWADGVRDDDDRRGLAIRARVYMALRTSGAERLTDMSAADLQILWGQVYGRPTGRSVVSNLVRWIRGAIANPDHIAEMAPTEARTASRARSSEREAALQAHVDALHLAVYRLTHQDACEVNPDNGTTTVLSERLIVCAAMLPPDYSPAQAA